MLSFWLLFICIRYKYEKRPGLKSGAFLTYLLLFMLFSVLRNQSLDSVIRIEQITDGGVMV